MINQYSIENLLHTSYFLSAWSSIKYVDNHHTFMSRRSWTGRLLFTLVWMVFHISFHFEDKHSWIIIRDVNLTPLILLLHFQTTFMSTIYLTTYLFFAIYLPLQCTWPSPNASFWTGAIKYGLPSAIRFIHQWHYQTPFVMHPFQCHQSARPLVIWYLPYLLEIPGTASTPVHQECQSYNPSAFRLEAFLWGCAVPWPHLHLKASGFGWSSTQSTTHPRTPVLQVS
jgi:hypothetical protein